MVKNIENVLEVSSNIIRTKPLSEYGLFLIYKIGTRGMAPTYAKTYINELKNNNIDNNIGKHFKFYKEVWLPNPETETVTVDIKLI